MKQVSFILATVLGIILLGVNVIYNGYLLSLIFGFIHSLFGFLVPKHNIVHSNFFWGMLGFGFLALAIGFGILFPKSKISQVVYRIRPMLATEDMQIKQNLSDAIALANKITKENNQPLLDKIDVFISEEQINKIYAVGHIVVVPQDLLPTLTKDEIKVLLLHAIAHVYFKFSIVYNMIIWANLPLKLIMWLYRYYVRLSLSVSKVFSHEGNLFSLALVIPLILFSPIAFLNFVGKWLIHFSLYGLSKLYKSSADHFVIELGFKNQLESLLHK